MDKSLKKIYQPDASQPSEEKQKIIDEKISEIERKYGRSIQEVVAEREEVLGRIAQMVGSDFGMKVKFGKIGGGSFFTPEDKNIPPEQWNTITLDPLILTEFEGVDEFVAGHEGAHRAITRTLEQVGFKPKQEREKQAQKIGWSFIHNSLEDPAVNNWVAGLYQRIGDILSKNYDKEFEKEGAIMSTPYIQEMIEMLGYVPNFVKYGSEVMRYWHKKEFSRDLPEIVQKALEQTSRTAESYWQEIPYTHPTERDVLQKARTRWQIYEKGIWPLVQKMIEEDLLDEKLKQYFKDQLQKALEQERQEGQEDQEGQKGQEGQERQEGQDGQVGQEEQEGQGGQEGREGQGGQEGREGQEGQDGGHQGGQKATKSQTEKSGKIKPQIGGDQKGQSLEDLMDQFGFDEKEKQEIREKFKEAMKRKQGQIDKLKEKLQNGEISQEEFDKAIEDIKDSMPIDMKSMSKSAKEKIEKKLNAESKEKQDEIAAKAEESLQNAEDVANETIKGKIGPKEESHKERRERQAKEAEEAKKEAEKIAKELEEKKTQEEKFKKWQEEQESKRTEWEKAVSKQAKTIDKLYKLIEEFFQKKKHPRWRKGYDAGQRLNLGMAMQYEADPRNYTRLWEKKTIPEKYDYRFTLLNDQSGSMREGNKAENDLIAKAMVTEVLTTLGIPCEVLGYTDSFANKVKKYKSFDEDLNEERERLMPELSKIIKEGGGGTPTLKATEIASASLALQERTRTSAHFLITITDGEPTDGSIEELQSLVKRLSKENDQIIIGMGIGEGISEENLKVAYGEGRYVYARNPEEFPDKMAALIEAIFMQSQGIK